MGNYSYVPLDDPHALNSYLDEYLNANGQTPHVAGLDYEGSPFVAWLDEEGGDSTYMVLRKLEVQDGGTTELLTGGRSSVVYPVAIMAKVG